MAGYTATTPRMISARPGFPGSVALHMGNIALFVSLTEADCLTTELLIARGKKP